MSHEQKQLLEFAIQDLVAAIAKNEELEPDAAMDRLYHSSFFLKLTDVATGLYRESGEYLYQAFIDSLSIA
jgi:hypothetical protein